MWKWKTNIGWECGAITGLLGRVENLFLIKLHILWKQLKAFTNVIWNNWCKYFLMFSLLVLTGMTDSFSLRLRLEFSPLQRFINLCVTMGHLSYTVSKDCVKKTQIFLFIMNWLIKTININMKKIFQQTQKLKVNSKNKINWIRSEGWPRITNFQPNNSLTLDFLLQILQMLYIIFDDFIKLLGNIC